MKNYNICIILLLTVVYLNYEKLLKKQKYLGGVDFIESYDVKLKKAKDNYRNIIHNIIRMEKILKYNDKFSNNEIFLTKLNYLKLQKNKEYDNLNSMLNSKKKTNNITNKLMVEENEPASKYARRYITELIHQEKYLNKKLKNIDDLVNSIQFLEMRNFNVYNRYN